MENRPIVRTCRLPMTNLFHAPMIRPLTADISSSNAVTRIYEETGELKNISADSLSAIAPSILKPAAQHKGNALIDNGWGEKRFRFFMEVEVDKTPYATGFVMLTGFTSHLGVSSGGHIDPNMRLYINSAVSYTDNMQRNNITGHQGINRVVQNNLQVIQPISNTPGLEFNKKLTPSDVVCNMSLMSYTDPDDTLIDNTSTRNIAGLASRSVALPSHYLNSIVGGSLASGMEVAEDNSLVTDAFNSRMNGYDVHQNGYEAYYAKYLSAVKNPTWSSNKFLSYIHTYTNYAMNGYVTWGELIGIFPELNRDDVVQVELLRTGPTNWAASTEHMRGMGVENQALAVIQSVLPAIMTMYLVQQASFTLTNATLTNMPEVVMSGLTPMSKYVDVNRLLTAFINKLNSQLAPAISNNNTMLFTVSVNANVLTEMMCDISINGQPPMQFVVPLYADSTFTSVGYATTMDLDNLTMEMESLTNALTVAIDQASMASGHSTGQSLAPYQGRVPIDNTPIVNDPFGAGLMNQSVHQHVDPLSNIGSQAAGSTADDPFARII